ncbi:hypothetical protein pb186bvf_004992 [Paramecium bursaria]
MSKTVHVKQKQKIYSPTQSLAQLQDLKISRSNFVVQGFSIFQKSYFQQINFR